MSSHEGIRSMPAETADTRPEERPLCPLCGATVLENRTSCYMCGTHIPTKCAVAEEAPESYNPRFALLLLGTPVLGALALLGYVAWVHPLHAPIVKLVVTYGITTMLALVFLLKDAALVEKLLPDADMGVFNWVWKCLLAWPVVVPIYFGKRALLGFTNYQKLSAGISAFFMLAVLLTPFLNSHHARTMRPPKDPVRAAKQQYIHQLTPRTPPPASHDKIRSR